LAPIIDKRIYEINRRQTVVKQAELWEKKKQPYSLVPGKHLDIAMAASLRLSTRESF